MTSSSYKIRAAKLADIEMLNELMHALHEHHHNAVPEDFKTADEVQEEKSIARYLDSPDCLVLVAELGDDIIGFVSAQFCELTSPISKPIFVGNVDELYTEPKYRNTGLGKALLCSVEQRLKELGVKQLMVEVWDFNQPALNLYKNVGFSSHIHCLRKKI
ncbi:N-acetyltransferase family protein [Vibrio sp. 10N.261.51.F12]|uniref:GNAT family N-acetyltransferase n=1 Tax=Vibrio sp. 10N.261.51.F12 TaxID=3229679 RepID=UPI00354E194E